MTDWLDLSPEVSLGRDGASQHDLRLTHHGLVCRLDGGGATPAFIVTRDGLTVASSGDDARRLVRHVAVVSSALGIVVDDRWSRTPERWSWQFSFGVSPLLATHARRCDVMGDGAGVRLYWLVPDGIRARVVPDGLVLETTQRSVEARLAVALLPYVGEPPLPHRFRDGDGLGIEVGGVRASVGSEVGSEPAIHLP